MTRSARVLSAGLYGVLAIFAAVSVHNFFAYIGHYPYWSIDDGLSVVSTSWLQTGRYGDPSVPIEGLSDLQRYRGFFIYGPWPFAAGSAMTWLFGFSVQALRAVHLLAALSLVFVGFRLFTGLRGATATTVLGVGVCYAVVQIEWPMVRPDIFVTLFAGGLIWSAAAATRDGRLRGWFWCGLAAGCGAFSHLIGASLFPASLIALVAGIGVRQPTAGKEGSAARRFTAPVVALGLGWVVSALVFYASFGFRFRDHITHLLRYRSTVQAMATTAFNSSSPLVVWGEHYRIATSGVPGAYLAAVVIALLVSGVLVCRALWVRDAHARDTVALLAPGGAVFGLYVTGLGWYPNFHTGYVILPQLVGIWIVASTLYVLLGEVRSRQSTRLLEPIVAIVVALLVARSAYRLWRADDDPRLAQARSWIAISSYLDEVLGPVPRHAVAWGAAPLAAEGPERVQLISLQTALWLMDRIPADRRPALAPDYILWGHPQSQDAVVAPFADPERDPLKWLPVVLPGSEFSVASIVSAAPYGATRVYQRRLVNAAPSRLPLISVWDAAQQRWLHEATPIGPLVWRTAAGSLRISKGRQRWTRRASDARAADLPAGWYLFRVDLTGDVEPRQILTAGAGSEHEFAAGDLPPPVDVVPRLAPESVYLLRRHEGGALGLNLFADRDDARINAVETFQISGLTDYRPVREQMAERPLPELGAWQSDAAGGVSAIPGGAELRVNGNATATGYQLVSPRIDVAPGAEVMVRLPVFAQAGRVCMGVLDEDRARWLARPVDGAGAQRFQAGRNRGFYVVVANCNADGAGVPSRFTVAPGQYAVLEDRWYVDTLMRAFTNRTR